MDSNKAQKFAALEGKCNRTTEVFIFFADKNVRIQGEFHKTSLILRSRKRPKPTPLPHMRLWLNFANKPTMCFSLNICK